MHLLQKFKHSSLPYPGIGYTLEVFKTMNLSWVLLSLTFEVARIIFQIYGPAAVAKLVEHLTTHLEIEGSNPDTTQHRQSKSE
jgi:hypothetical protein